MIFAIFINRGTLIIEAEPPYNVQINDFKNLNCLEKNCQTSLAPGNYQLTLKKDGYQQLKKNVSIPIGGKTEIQADFIFIPYISKLDPEDSLRIFKEQKLPEADLKKIPGKSVFYDSNALAYVALNPQNNLSTLYTRSFQDDKLGEEQLISTFQRELKSFNLIPDLNNQRIGLIDYSSGQSAFYIINLKNKTRTNVLNFPFIKNIKFLPGSSDFIFEGKNEFDLKNSLYLYRQKTDSTQKLDLNTFLENVVPLTENRLIAATNQKINSEDSLAMLEGDLVTFQSSASSNIPVQAESTGQAGTSEPGLADTGLAEPAEYPQLNFIDFSFVNLQSRLIKTTTKLPFPSKLIASQDKKSVYFADQKNSYELHLDK